MAKATFIAQSSIRGLKPPAKDGTEHILDQGGSVELDPEDGETMRLVACGALVKKGEEPAPDAPAK